MAYISRKRNPDRNRNEILQRYIFNFSQDVHGHQNATYTSLEPGCVNAWQDKHPKVT